MQCLAYSLGQPLRRWSSVGRRHTLRTEGSLGPVWEPKEEKMGDNLVFEQDPELGPFLTESLYRPPSFSTEGLGGR